jgi:hypothetical protein
MALAVGRSTPVNGSSSRRISASCANRLGDERALALPSGQLAEPPPGQVLDAELGHRARDELVVAGAEPPEPAEVAPAAHPDDVEDGDREHRVDREVLRQVGDPPPARRQRAAHRRDEPDQGGEQRALARPVRPEDGDRRAGGHGEVDVVERDDLAVGDGQPADRHGLLGDGGHRGRGAARAG